jgi:hypothetical protein
LAYKIDADYICDDCAQILLEVDQVDLKRAYKKAAENGHPNKAKAIELFLVPQEAKDDRKTKKTRRDMVRKRPLRKTRPCRHQFRT